MNDQYLKVGINRDGKRLFLTEPGIGILKAVVMKWMDEAERGLVTAREMARTTENLKMEGQYQYYKNALAFLSGKVFNIKEVQGYDLTLMLRYYKQWPDKAPIPPKWHAFLLHSMSVETDGTGIPTGGGGGSDGDIVSGSEVHGQEGHHEGGDGSSGDPGDRKAGRPRATGGRPKERTADRGRKRGSVKGGKTGDGK